MVSIDDRKTSDEFRSAWEKMHNDKYNEIAFMMFDRVQAKWTNMNLTDSDFIILFCSRKHSVKRLKVAPDTELGIRKWKRN